MMCQKQGKTWPKLRSKFPQLGSIICTHVCLCMYLPYQSKILYNPNTLLWHTYCAITLTLEELIGFLVVLFPLSNLDLPLLGFLAYLIEAIPMIKLHKLLK